MITGLIGLSQALCLVMVLKICVCQVLMCTRQPLGTKTNPLPADNLFAIEIVGADQEYIPLQNYTIRLYSKNEKLNFIAFTIFATGDTKYNEKNPRKPQLLQVGRIWSYSDGSSPSETTEKEGCDYTLIETNTKPKTEVKALWRAPPKENKCVTIQAYVAIQKDVWYSSDGPLSKRVCEDRRKIEDMLPDENDNCTVCEEARYLLTFEGTWSYNTHPRMFPSNKNLSRFSDLIGASHNKNYYVFKLKYDAKEGLTMLAEQGNTTQLEGEILQELGTGNVRTLIKATGPPKPNMSTVTSFRASRDKHLMSFVTAIMPSPDWFIGVSNLELCKVDNQWAQEIKLNLYPFDAGTDTGLTFEAANDNTSPKKPVSMADIDKDIPRENMKPFAKLKLELVRTYSTPECITEAEETLTEGDDREEPDEPEPPQPPPTHTRKPTIKGSEEEEPPATAPPGSRCVIGAWEEWPECGGPCVDGKVTGYRTRFRYPVIFGKTYGKNSGDENKYSPGCLPESDTERCEDDCEEPTEEPQADTEAQRRMSDYLRPGYNWG